MSTLLTKVAEAYSTNPKYHVVTSETLDIPPTELLYKSYEEAGNHHDLYLVVI